ncbi:MAG: hypothetical protein JWO82_169 [Akkermansiaceae bacterium]|nr:hypothetical protein [Akkermansiaceae bacterium]
MLFRILSLFLAATLVTQAAGKRHFRTLYFGKPASAPESLTMTYGESSVSIPLPSANLSPSMTLPDGALNVVFTTAPLPPKSEPPPAAPKAEIPDGWNEVLFLFTPDPANTLAPVRVTAIDLGHDKFKPGQLLVFNRSQAFIGGRIGKQTLKLPAMKSTYVEAPAEGDSDYAVSIDMILPGEKDQKTLCRSTWRQVAADQMLVFVLPDPVRKSLSIASVPIHPLPPDKPE